MVMVMVVAGVCDHRQHGAAATRHRTIRRNGRQIGHNHQGDGGAITERSIIERDQRCWIPGIVVVHPERSIIERDQRWIPGILVVLHGGNL